MTINWDGMISACCVVDDVKADFADFFNALMINSTPSGTALTLYPQRASFVAKEDEQIHTICHECKKQPWLSRFVEPAKALSPSN